MANRPRRRGRAARARALRDNGGVSQANDKVAALIEEYADLYVMTGGDPFRARVYSKAARALAAQTQDVTGLSGPALLRIPGVGKSIAAKVGEISTTGTFAELEELRADIPDGVRQLTRIPALGPRRALQLYRELQISSPEQLRDAIAAGQLNDLKGFGPKSAEKLLRGLDLLATAGGRVLLNVAAETAASVIEAVGAVGGCQRIAPAGSLRRAKESIGDVDVLAAADDSAPLMAALTAMPDAVEVIAAGPTKTSIRTAAGLQVDLRVVALDAWGAALQYFTGSQEHNVRDPGTGRAAQAQAVRVWPVRHRVRGADRVPDRGRGVPAPRHAVDPADAARGHRRGGGRAQGRATRARDAAGRAR